MTAYLIGVSKQNITRSKKKLQLQGMADERQKSEGVLHKLYARAFIISDGSKEQVIVVADIWSCTKALKDGVISYLSQHLDKGRFVQDNVMIMGTHTHSAPGGYAGYQLFDEVGGANLDTYRHYVRGIGNAIINATKKIKTGKIFFGTTTVENCGIQRSENAYLNNPQKERDRYTSDTDKTMYLIKLTHDQANGTDHPVGMINWFATHPTDLGQYNKKVSGDNKGVAGQLFEVYAKTAYRNASFVSAFANANCGDVTGRIRSKDDDGSQDFTMLNKHANIQFEAAKKIYNDKSLIELTGVLHTWFGYFNMSRTRIKNTPYRTWPYALGYSFAAGSSDDGLSVLHIVGITCEVNNVKEGLTKAEIRKSKKYKKGYALARSVMPVITATIQPANLPSDEIKGHGVKPIVLAPRNQSFIVPHILPLQVYQIDPVMILGFPGELTTMAGRRLRESIFKKVQSMGIQDVILSTYTNDYTQYTTTKEEYAVQYYEGASTPYGPYTLQGYTQNFAELIAGEDVYIDCESKLSQEVKFEVNYSIKGKVYTLSSRKRMAQFRFSLPADADAIRLRAHRQSASGRWRVNRWEAIKNHGPGSANHLVIDSRGLSNKGLVAKKEIYVANASSKYLEIECWFTNLDGIREKYPRRRNIMNFYTVKLPWYATYIKIRVGHSHEPSSNQLIWTNWLNIAIGAHQRYKVNFQFGALQSVGEQSPWF